MSDVIASNEEAASELAATVKNALSGYLDFTLCSLHAVAPVSGSLQHDNLSSSIRKALARWDELITSDAKALEGAVAEFGSLDAALAGELLGVRGETSCE